MLAALLVRSKTSFSFALAELRKRKIEATIVDAAAVHSLHHLEMAAELAKKSLADGTAVSARLEMEFLLWLGQSSHVEEAIRRAGAKDGEAAWLVLFDEERREGDEKIKQLAGELKLEIMKEEEKQKTYPRALHFWRVKNENLLFEQMALCRIRN